MTDYEKEILKDKIAFRLDEIYKQCGKDYVKFVEKIEQMEKDGLIKSEYLARDNTKNIWNT